MSWKRYEVDAVSLRVKGKTRREGGIWRCANGAGVPKGGMGCDDG